MVATRDPHVVPVEVVSAFFVADPIALGIPKRSGIETNYTKPGSCQALNQHSSARTHSDNGIIELFTFPEATHWTLNPLHRAEHVRLAVRRPELTQNRSFQWLPPWPGEPWCSSSPPTCS